MKKLTVNVGDTYEILIEKGLLKSCGSLISKVTEAKKVVVISETNVAPLYLDTVMKSIEAEGFEIYSYIFPAGESSKTTSTVIKMVEFLAEKELTRNDLVITLGGGVCGDMGGFAAAIYLRGIKFIQIPTTLLAQVDSSVGGKTGTNLPHGKNLCGAFHQPALVIMDPDVLDTLPGHVFSEGMAEAIKAGCIKSKSLFERIKNEDARDFIEDLIYECVDIKRGVVERDEKEHGERALLNFGHTAGHGIEKLYNFTGISHGEAVGIGMVMIADAGEKAGITEKGTSKSIAEVLEKYKLKTFDNNHSAKDIISAMGADKKRTGSGIKFVMLEKIGTSFIYPVKTENIGNLFGVEA